MRNLLVVVGVLIAVTLTGGAYAQQFVAGLPSVRGLDSASFGGDVILTDRHGIVLADLGYGGGNHRQYEPLAKISPWLVKATVAVEDKNFYKNQGFDLAGILRAALTDYRQHGTVSGGSTITQQLAKQLFLTPEQTWQRKVKEIALAYELTQTYSKNQILELYLNRTYYGAQAYGVEAAALTYFQKDAADLDLAQASMIAGLPRAPSDYDPFQHPDSAKARQAVVLDSMVRNGYITQATSDAAYKQDLNIKTKQSSFLAPHFVDWVQGELTKLGFMNGQQITVTTSLDLKTQQIAEKVVRDNLKANKYRDPSGKLQSAMVAMDPRTGQVIAMVGSSDYNNSPGGQYNFAADVARNPGSSVKLFTYAAALNLRKVTMDTIVYDGPSRYYWPGPWGNYYVTNYIPRAYGDQPVKYTLPNSLNISAVKVEQATGIPNVVQFDRNIGIFPRDSQGNPNGNPNGYTPPLTLGSYPITLLEEVNGLSAAADLGVYHAPEGVLQIQDARGKTIYSADPNKTRRQAYDAGAAYIEAQILSNDNNRRLVFGTGTPLHLDDRHAAAKTGTNDNFKDALTIGFTPTLASVFWVGDIGPLNSTMSNNSDGVYVAAPAWHDFMEQALKGVPDQWYTAPPDVVKKGNDYFLLDAQDIPTLRGPRPSPLPQPTPTGPTVVVVSPGYTIPSPPSQPIQPYQPSPSPDVSPTPSPGQGRLGG
ncbi:MAG TPA: transglycosylase domain-containing protein [Candidatus Dormibacteraeota bacterium]